MLFFRAALATLSIAVAAPSVATADTTGISYEQFSRTYLNQPDTSKGTYDEDAAILRAANAKSTDAYPAAATGGRTLSGRAGMPGSLATSGSLERFSYLGTLSRVDDLLAQKSTIADPDNQRIIYLDLAAKTYRTVTGNAAKALLAPVDLAALAKRLGVGMKSETGSETLTLASVSKPAGTRLIDGVRAVGTHTRFSSTTSHITGSCPALNDVVEETTFVDPDRVEPASAAPKVPKSLPLETSLTGCRVTFKNLVKDPQPRVDHFVLVRKSSMIADPSLHVKLAFGSVVERGHVVALTGADADRFTIPADFRAEGAPAASAAPPAPTPSPVAPTAPAVSPTP